MLYLSRFYVLCPAQSGTAELYISTDPEWRGPNCISRTLLTLHQQEGRGTFQEVQSLKKNVLRKSFKKLNLKNKKNKIKKEQENGRRLPFRTCSPAAHKQKSLLPVSVTALIQAQTDPIAEDLLVLHPA